MGSLAYQVVRCRSWGTCRSDPDGLLSCSAMALHPIAGPAELIQNVRSYISTIITVQQNINVYTIRHAEAAC